MYASSGRNVHRLVCLWWDPIQTWAFAVLQFIDGSVDFLKGNGGVDVVEDWSLEDFVKNARVDGAVIVEYSLKVRSKYCHIFFSIGGRFAICHLHCHFHFLLVMTS